MKYKSELIKNIVDTRGHKKSSLHYESECVESWINETKGAYPKLTDYESEWLNYIAENPIGIFPYEALSDITEATVNNVVPYDFKSAILKGNTKYRDIDTGDILDTFDETKNLELVSVRMPVLSTVGKNLFDKSKVIDNKYQNSSIANGNFTIANNNNFMITDFIKIKPNTTYTKTDLGGGVYYDENKNAITDVSISSNIFTTPNNANYIIINIEKAKHNLNKGQLEEGTTATSYEPFKSNILTVNEEVELRGIGDVQDELNLMTGELTKRITKIVLNGSQNMDADGRGIYIQVDDMKKVDDYITIITCDKLPVFYQQWDLPSVENGISGYCDEENKYPGQNWLYIKINNSIDVDEVRQILTQNPITVQYALAEESIKTVDLNVVDQYGNTLSKIKPIEGSMHLSTDGNPIKPTFTGEVPIEAITQNLTSFIQEE